MDKVAVVIVNYNMPERADALAEHIRACVRWPHDLIVVDNRSDLVPSARSTNVRLTHNVQTTGGWLAGLDYADDLGGDYLAYWFLITSAEFVDDSDPLTPMAQLLMDDENAVGAHPALTPDSTTAWKHLHARGGPMRRTWMIDNIASLYRASWFDAIGRFDPAMSMAWGIDLETCWLARSQDRSLWVHEGVQVKKVTDIGYTMNRMNMSADARRSLAGAEMAEVLGRKYGSDWNNKMRTEYVDDAWR